MKNLFFIAAFITTFFLLIPGINASSSVFECMDDIYDCNAEYFGVHTKCVSSRYYVQDVCDYPEFGCRIDLESSGTLCGSYTEDVKYCIETYDGHQHEVYKDIYTGYCDDSGKCVVDKLSLSWRCEGGCNYNKGECKDIKCVESDDGIDPEEYSTCKDNFNLEYDRCYGNTLYEYYCNPDEECEYVSKECDGGCKSGACLDCPPELIANDGQPCTESSECCAGCFGTRSSSSYTCHSSCAVDGIYAADSKACCGGAPYTNGKCEKSSVTSGVCDVYNTNSIYDYNRRLNCEADGACMWCGLACPPGTSNCNSCKYAPEHYCCEGVYQTGPCEGCNPPIPNAPSTSCDYLGNCFSYNSCPGTTVTIDMEEGNTVQGCTSTSTSYSSAPSGKHQAHWYNVKGALGEAVDIQFKNNNCQGEMNLHLYNRPSCDLYSNDYYSAIYYEFATISSTGTVTIKDSPGVPSGFANSLSNDAGIPNRLLRINKMPYGGIIMALTSTCDGTKCPYCIRINSTDYGSTCG